MSQNGDSIKTPEVINYNPNRLMGAINLATNMIETYDNQNTLKAPIIRKNTIGSF